MEGVGDEVLLFGVATVVAGIMLFYAVMLTSSRILNKSVFRLSLIPSDHPLSGGSHVFPCSSAWGKYRGSNLSYRW